MKLWRCRFSIKTVSPLNEKGRQLGRPYGTAKMKGHRCHDTNAQGDYCPVARVGPGPGSNQNHSSGTDKLQSVCDHALNMCLPANLGHSRIRNRTPGDKYGQYPAALLSFSREEMGQYQAPQKIKGDDPDCY